MINGIFDVRDPAFGALGDGTTDDTVAIQNAINAASAYPAGGPSSGGTVYFPAGNYVIGTPGVQPPNLYVTGKVNLEGSPGAILTLSALPTVTPLEPNLMIAPGFWISLGSASPSDVSQGSLWSGRISGLRFTVNPNIALLPDTPQNYANLPGSELAFYILYFHNCDGFTIENNVFDIEAYATSTPSPCSMSGTGNAPWNPVPPHLSNGTIRGNIIKAAMGYYGEAGIAVAGGDALANRGWNIVIENNHISGVADEVIGLHGISNAIVRDNFCCGTKAGIWLEHCQSFIVEGNHVERGPAAAMPLWGLGAGTWWQGGLILAAIEDADYTAPPCTDGRIVNNEFVVSPPPGTPAPLQIPTAPVPGTHNFMQLGGLRRAIVANNLLRCDTPFVSQPALIVEPFASPGGWIDSEGLDQDQIARPRDIRIEGNRAVGAAVNGDPGLYPGAQGVFQMGESQPGGPSAVNCQIAGPITWHGNEANSFIVFGTRSSFSVSNQIIGASGSGMQNVDGYLVPDALLLWIGTAVDTGRHTVVVAENGGGARFFPLRHGIVFYVKATVSRPVPAGTVIKVHLAKNGAINPSDDLEIDSATPYAKRRYYGATSPGANNQFTPDDFLEAHVERATHVHRHGEIHVRIELFGMYTGNGSVPGR